MIDILRSAQRGHANHGWLDSFHSFAFGEFYDPQRMGFGDLRVVNEDRVEAGKGFRTHGHKNMEIVSYVLDGVLEHKDSMGNGSQMRRGEVQLMSAGTGVTHSEFNASNTDELHFLQMWVVPAETETEPRYEQKLFPEDARRNRLQVVVSPDGRDASLTIGQDACLLAGFVDAGHSITHATGGRILWLQVARGTLRVGDATLEAGDAAAIRDEDDVKITSVEGAELVGWSLAAR